jgi:general secretion pathway protein I
MQNKCSRAFSLIEVLLALAIIAIALTALLKATSHDIVFNTRIKSKMLSHWVSLQGISMGQLGLLPLQDKQEISQRSVLLQEEYYWRISMQPTSLSKVKKLFISTSQSQNGPFNRTLVGYKYIEAP